MRTVHLVGSKKTASKASTSTAAGTAASLTQDELPPPVKKSKLTDYFKSSDSMEMIVSRLVALDGLPISKFCTSEDLRKLFKKCGHNLPNSPSTITNIILNQKEVMKNNLNKKIREMKDNNKKFSVTLDEYTSLKNKRYMNVNIHNHEISAAKFKKPWSCSHTWIYVSCR